MALIDVTAKKDNAEATIQFDFGDTVEQAIELFGAEVVHSNFVAQSKIQLQALMRSRLASGTSCDDLANIWKPGVKVAGPKVDPLVAAAAKYQDMTDEEKAAFIAMLKGEATAE